jgi:hypothetical protein
MGLMDRVAAQIERDVAREQDFGRLVHTSADGWRTYVNEVAGRVTVTSPGDAATLRTTVVGVGLAALC